MANASPVKFPRPKGFYSETAPESPGLKTVSLGRPTPATSRESRRCPECQAKVWLLDGADEATCTCGAVAAR
jgi:hypothetical protein